MRKRTKAAVESLLIDSLEVCQILGVKSETWRTRVRSGIAPLPHAHMGQRSYYRRADILHFATNGVWPEGMQFKSR